MADLPDEEDQARWDAFRDAWETTEQALRAALPPEMQAALERPMYYSPDGDPLSFPDWTEMMFRKHEEVRQRGEIPRESWWCRKTMIEDQRPPDRCVEISTVWLGIDHNHIGIGPPLIWETMIFGGDWDHEHWRYTNRAHAYDHHEEIVRALRAGKDPNTQTARTMPPEAPSGESPKNG